MMSPKTYVFDPLFPSTGFSHHASVKKFLEKLEVSNVIYLDLERFENVKCSGAKSLKFRKFSTGFYLFRKTVDFSFKYRKMFKGNTVFLPHADLISTILLLAARKLKIIDVKLTIRLIGIHDFSTLRFSIKRIVKIFLNSCLQADDKLAAETKALVRSFQGIQRKVDSVIHAPYPGFLELAKEFKPSFGDRLLFIGNPREDKGYVEVLRTAKTYPSLRMRIQLPASDDLIFRQALIEIGPLPNVQFFEAPTGEGELIAEIANAQALLMPYSKLIFSERGSGILTAGILMKKVVFGFEETSFKEECTGFTLFYDWKDIKKSLTSSCKDNKDDYQDYSQYVIENWERLLS